MILKIIKTSNNACSNHIRTASSTSKKTNASQYCMENVRKFDKENFLCTLLLDKSIRTPALVIRAFNIEIARIHDQVTDHKIGAMRFQFWEDTLSKVFGKNATQVPNHPVAMELFKVAQQTKLSKQYFTRLISSRKQNLPTNPFPTLQSLEQYAENSVSSVLYLILECANVRNVNADHAASHLGKAQGLTNMIRATPFVSSKRVLTAPQELLVKNSLSEEQFMRGSSNDRAKDVVFELASRAHQHLLKARSLKKDIPKEAHSVLLPGIPVGNYLERLQKNGFDVYDPKLKSSSPTLPFELWWNNVRHNY